MNKKIVYLILVILVLSMSGCNTVGDAAIQQLRTTPQPTTFVQPGQSIYIDGVVYPLETEGK